jgi:Rod binding domain-containing protein
MNNQLINPAAATPVAVSPPTPESRRLREACQKFEGMLLGIMMKEALRETLSEPVGDAAPGMDSFRDFCIEQVAHTMAETSSLGISDQLYAELGIGGGGNE